MTVLVLGVHPPPSHAHDRFMGQQGCLHFNGGDSAAHGFWYNGNLSEWMQAATSWSRSANYDGTDVDTFYVPALAFDTDVVVYDQNYTDYCGYSWHGPGEGVRGLAECKALAANTACERFEVRYDESYTVPVNIWGERSLACHELGHTLGLVHTANGSCTDTPSGPTKFGLQQTEVNWINGAYP